MGTDAATADRLLAPTGVSDIGEDKLTSMGERLLMVFAGFIAVVGAASGLALLVISIAALFE